MTDHGAEMDAILELLEGAGLVEVYVNADGKQAMHLTDDGERVARQMAMSDDPDAVLITLLAPVEEARPSRDGPRARCTSTDALASLSRADRRHAMDTG